MTTLLPHPETQIEQCRHDLTRREKLLVAIWEAWRDGRTLVCRDLATAAGYKSIGSLRLGELEEAGWITRSFGRDKARAPGPAFVGIDRASGRPLRLIG